MSAHVIGFAPPDDEWRRMKAVWDACINANVPVPDYVAKFFDWQEPDERGVEVEIPATEWEDDLRDGYEIEVSKIPPQVKFIRFYNSY